MKLDDKEQLYDGLTCEELLEFWKSLIPDEKPEPSFIEIDGEIYAIKDIEISED